MATVTDTATPLLRRLERQAMDMEAIHKVAAVAVMRLIRDGFVVKANTQRNKFGRPPQFWKRMIRGTRYEASSTSAVVIMPREVALRRFGGLITPTGGRRLLTIPAQAATYRTSAKDYADLVLIIFKKRTRGPVGALMRHLSKGFNDTGGGTTDVDTLADQQKSHERWQKRQRGMEVMFWLVRQSRQKPDPSVMPSDAEITATALAAVNRYLAGRGGGSFAAAEPGPGA